MIRVTVEISEGTVSRRVEITARNISRALELAGHGLPGRTARVVFPIPPEAFFADGGTLAETTPVAPEPAAA